MFSLFSRGRLLLALGLLAAPAGHAQEGPLAEARATQDPFGRPLAPELPGGHYKSHRVVDEYGQGKPHAYLYLDVQATDGSLRRIQTWAPGVVKISYFAPGYPPVADSSVSVVQPPQPVQYETACNHGCDGPPPAAISQQYGPDVCSGVSVYADKLSFRVNCQRVVIDKQTLAITLYGPDDTPLLSEAAAPYCRQPRSPAAPGEATPPSRADELAGTGVRLRLQPGERLYGTGARALPLDRRGYRLALYNQAHYGYQNGEPNLNVSLPVVLSSRGYLVLFDHYAAAYLDLGKQRANALEYGAQGLSSLSYFVVTGQSQGEILDRYTALTGRQPLPPRWALGLIQSRFGYRSQAELLEVAHRMRAADFPLDALVLDLYWFGGTTRQGDFRWDSTHFTDPAGMLRTLRGQGVQTILISEPYVMRTSLNDSLVRTQGLVGTTAAGRPYTVGSFWAGPASILDVFKPQTRAWLWAQYRRLHAQGVGGWWSDLGEPENHPLAMHHALGTAAQVHNAYGHTWAGILREGYAREYPQERLFNLARSGWAGMQRNAVFPWSGDISRSWSGLQAQVPLMLGMGQAGVGYMHSDAGGFGGNATRDPELYTRWLQLAALGPVMRPHSDQVVPPEPYTYPEPYRSSVRHYAHLRYELLPYLYTLAAQNTLTGAPLTRALDYYSYGPQTEPYPPARLDSAASVLAEGNWGTPTPEPTPGTRATGLVGTPAPAWQPPRRSLPPAAPAPRSDEYLLGPSLLVAPVSQPGQRRRNVALPTTPGNWILLETGQTLPAAPLAGVPAPLARLPLLVRAGALIPGTAYRPTTAAYRPDTTVVRYFPDPAVPASAFTLYEDDGHSAQALARHEFATIELVGRTVGSQISFQATVAGYYPGAPTARAVQLRVARVAGPPVSGQLNGQALPASAWHYEAARHELLVTLALRQTATLTFSGLRLLTQPAAGFDPEVFTLLMPASRVFGTQAQLAYERFGAGPGSLHIRNAHGQLVRELATSEAPGVQQLSWDGRNAHGQVVPPGCYDVELAGQHQALVKLAP